ncbi:TIGR04104 family putative zinc finger protein [Ureibacillus aquaedulcis]|uniref:CXXC-20-CXXC protein n=1 Tax=Ureibacillus aquaedulcis TaxID=3058421 RepID=A0ABT8GPF6_9BACL|nr:TIGR04104 family putative zinc finger protein [Ureibacillus sp. BA0131]MDN4493298.1 hypothetical protein [Ureibacillus sp. BA0131]
MKIEKPFKEAWKKELDFIYMKPEMKEELIKKVISQGGLSSSGKWTYPTVMATFALGIVFFLVITIQGNPQYLTGSPTQATNTFLLIERLFYTEKFYWVAGTILLETITVLLFFEVIKKTKRWQSKQKIRYFNKLLATKRRNLLIPGFCCIFFGAVIAYIASIVSLNTIQILASFIMVLFNCLLMLWFIRKLNKSTCPHCGYTFSRKELFKNTWSTYRVKCNRCEEEVYYSYSSSKNYLYMFIPIITHYGLGFLGIPFAIAVFSYLLVGLFFNFYIMNFTTIYSEKDEPLW